MSSKKIGHRLMLIHAFSSMISAKSIGDDCIIYQQVTIGNGKGGTPRIGNNVIIYPGAKIVGGIVIGDDCIIGANSVVTKDVVPHSVVAGVPAKIVSKRNSRNEKWSRV